jgi:hypothetical protein
VQAQYVPNYATSPLEDSIGVKPICGRLQLPV